MRVGRIFIMARLLLKNGGGQPQEFPLPAGSCRVGRNRENNLHIEDPSVSSFHCEIRAEGPLVSVRDLGSTNGTFIDEQPIQQGFVTHGQRLRLGTVELILDASAEVQPGPGAAASSPAPERPRFSVKLDQSLPESTAGSETQPALAAVTRAPQGWQSGYKVDWNKAQQEARSKVFWGEDREEVIKYLRMQGFELDEASAVTESLMRERASTLRGIGIQKTLTGIALMCVPVIAWIYFSSIGVIPLKLFGATCVVGVYGAWRFLKGTIMFVAPRSEPGDVADK